MRPCGSVKLRCALGAGSSDDGLAGLLAAAVLLLLLDAALLVGRGLRLSLQLSLASAILAIRFCLSATQSGSSSPRLLPCSRSSSASAACRQPAIDLGLQFGLTHLHVPIAHCLGLVFGRIRLDLGAAERDMPEPHQPAFSANFDTLRTARPVVRDAACGTRRWRGNPAHREPRSS